MCACVVAPPRLHQRSQSQSAWFGDQREARQASPSRPLPCPGWQTVPVKFPRETAEEKAARTAQGILCRHPLSFKPVQLEGRRPTSAFQLLKPQPLSASASPEIGTARQAPPVGELRLQLSHSPVLSPEELAHKAKKAWEQWMVIKNEGSQPPANDSASELLLRQKISFWRPNPKG